MRFERNKTLLIIFLFLLGILVIPSIIQKVTTRVGIEISDQEEPFFGSFNLETLDGFTISKSGASLNFSKEGEKWLVNGKLASQNDVSSLIQLLKDLKVSDLVSKNPQNHVEMGVDDATGDLLVLKSGDSAFSIVIGKSNSVGGFYIRRAGEDNTYSAAGLLQSRMIISESSWRDKTVVSLPNLSEVFLAGSQNVTYNSDSADWDEIKSLFNPLSGYSNLTEDEIREFEDLFGKDSITLTADDGSLVELLLADNKGAYWIQSGEEYYKVSSADLELLFSN